MEALDYRFEELTAIVRLTAEFMRGSGDFDAEARLTDLADAFEAEFAGVFQLENAVASAIAVSLSGMSQELTTGLNDVLYAIWNEQRVDGLFTSIIAGGCLASICQVSPRNGIVLLLHRNGGPFGLKTARALQLIHSVIQPKLNGLQASMRSRTMPRRLRQVQQGLLDGLSEKQIATRLQLSPNTIHVYVKDLFRRCGVSSRGQLLSQFVMRECASVETRRDSAGKNHQIPGREFKKPLKQVAAPPPIAPILRPAGEMLFRAGQSAGESVHPPPYLQCVSTGFETGHDKIVTTGGEFQ